MGMGSPLLRVTESIYAAGLGYVKEEGPVQEGGAIGYKENG